MHHTLEPIAERALAITLDPEGSGSFAFGIDGTPLLASEAIRHAHVLIERGQFGPVASAPGFLSDKKPSVGAGGPAPLQMSATTG
ncbi:MAG: hypothetical protein K8S94_06300 [Planctomycetia bacterium]|nr:hypothetical protein [Planctomycetia bacterium]